MHWSKDMWQDGMIMSPEASFNAPPDLERIASLKRAGRIAAIYSIDHLSQLSSSGSEQSDEPINKSHILAQLSERGTKELAHLEYPERSALINQVIDQYHDHPVVSMELANYANNAKIINSYNPDPIGQYLQDIVRYPLLDKDEEVALFNALDFGLALKLGASPETVKKYRIEDEVENALIASTVAARKAYYSNLRLVVHYARPYFKNKNCGLDAIDYIQEGNIALQVAIEHFNAHKGFKFSTYATYWIRQALQRAFAGKSRQIHIPADLHNEWIEILRHQDELADQLSRQPTAKEIAENTRRTASEISDILVLGSHGMQSLNEPLSEASDDEVGDLIGADDSTKFHDSLAIRDMISAAIASSGLSDQELIYLSLRFNLYVPSLTESQVSTASGRVSYDKLFKSLDPDKNMPITQLAKLLGKADRSLRNLEVSVLNKIRDHLEQ